MGEDAVARSVAVGDLRFRNEHEIPVVDEDRVEAEIGDQYETAVGREEALVAVGSLLPSPVAAELAVPRDFVNAQIRPVPLDMKDAPGVVVCAPDLVPVLREVTEGHPLGRDRSEEPLSREDRIFGIGLADFWVRDGGADPAVRDLRPAGGRHGDLSALRELPFPVDPEEDRSSVLHRGRNIEFRDLRACHISSSGFPFSSARDLMRASSLARSVRTS